ncbi:hypothetical protein K7X08_002811 [Anisodus acutangulus]|uniref:Uncharacterized protein n=1 Tax=Anisodus acutangulus TaxID=402998 RepID=A0A9Q1MCM6_9SOLA|nr:hypothetical protein K7X08_002811 [Anisodus acutangulus]
MNEVYKDDYEDDDVLIIELTTRRVRHRLRKASGEAIPKLDNERNEKEGTLTLMRTPHTRGHKRKDDKELEKAMLSTKRSRSPRSKATKSPPASMKHVHKPVPTKKTSLSNLVEEKIESEKDDSTEDCDFKEIGVQYQGIQSTVNAEYEIQSLRDLLATKEAKIAELK